MIGNRTRAKVVKNKLAPPFKAAEFDIIYGKGVSQAGCLLDIGVETGLIEKSGSWFSINGDKIAQGREKARDYIEANPEIAAWLDEEIRQRYFVTKEETAGGSDE